MKLFILENWSVLSTLDDTNFIVNISEDGWFGDSVGPYINIFLILFLEPLKKAKILFVLQIMEFQHI